MGKPETSGGASTYIYGLIFVLYAGIAVVLFIYMMNKRSKQQKPAESETATEPTTKDKAEKTDSSSKPKPTDRAAKEASPVATKEKGAAEGMSEVAKETTFVSPTEEEINQLCQPEKEGEAKKKE